MRQSFKLTQWLIGWLTCLQWRGELNTMRGSLFLLFLLCGCATEYVHVNTCVPDICEEPTTVEDYIIAYQCKARIVETCNKKLP